MTDRAALYLRVSTVYQVNKDSLPMQRENLTAYCDTILHCSYDVYEDAGYSGKNTDRPQFKAMMKKIRAGEYNRLIVWKIDRISRNLIDFATLYQELKKLGVTFISMNEQFDTSSAIGEAMLKIIMVFAELERNMTSERVTATMISRAQSGRWNGSPIPYGYEYDKNKCLFSIDENEAEIVRKIHNDYESLKSLNRLTNELNSVGLTTRSGSMWTPPVLSHILNSYFYCGDYLYNVHNENHQNVKDESKWVIVKDHHPAIVSREQKERVIKKLNFNDRMITHNRTHFYHAKNIHIFGGMVYCEKCGKIMHSSVINKTFKHSSYICQTRRRSEKLCNQQSVSDVIIGEFVFNLIVNMLRCQRVFTKSMTNDDLSKILLDSQAFKHVLRIADSSMSDFRSVLSSGIIAVYKNDIKPSRDSSADIKKLHQRKQKLERAVSRLSDLFLFSDDVMTDVEYIKKKNDLIAQITEVDNLIEASKETIPDQSFLQLASEFIIERSLEGRNYVYYKRLAKETEQETLRDFTEKVIERITVYDKNITSVSFLNGITMNFEYS